MTSSSHDPAPAVAPARLLRSRGLKVTAPRVAVLDAVAAAPHADAERIVAAVRSTGADISRASVYNVLTALSTAGLLRRIEPAGSPARYETRTGDNHHHVVCRSCGHTADVDCVAGSRNCLEPDDTAGFLVDEAEVIFWGLCPACRSAASAAPPADEPYPG